MPLPSIGLIVLCIVIAVGVVFMLWVLYHLVLESRPRKRRQYREWPTGVSQEEDRNRSKKSAILILCTVACLSVQSVRAQSTSPVTADALEQKLTVLQRQIDEARQELDELKAKGACFVRYRSTLTGKML